MTHRTPAYGIHDRAPKSYWAEQSDLALQPLFAPDKDAPTPKQLRDAYPFGERSNWPYKVWLGRVRYWRHQGWKGLDRANKSKPPPDQAALAL